MRSAALVAAVAGTGLLIASGAADAPKSGRILATTHKVSTATPAPLAPSRSEAMPAEDLTAVVQQYCVVCHNDQALTGNLTLQAFDVAAAGTQAPIAEKMIRKLRAGMMPPPGLPRPAGDTLLQLVQTLENEVDAAARANPNLGVRRFPRLSRAEYERAIHDLMGLEVDAGKWLPPDVLSGSFDNMSASQALSTTLLDAYLRAAIDVSRLALGNPNAAPVTTQYKTPFEVSQHAWDHVEGTPFGTRGGTVVTHDFPADGTYTFQVLTRFGGGNSRSISTEQVDISIDGESVALLALPHNGAGVISEIKTEPVFVQAGQHKVSAAFVNLVDGPYEDRFRPTEWSAAGLAGEGYGVTGLAHLTHLLITGPDEVRGVSDTPTRQKIFTCRPGTAAEERSCAESILGRLAMRAYRRPVNAERLEALMNFYEVGAADGGFENGVRSGLQAILASPEFLFRLEREPSGAQAGRSYRISPIDLASRISFFLWATVPDDELLQVAASGTLTDPGVLERQVRRMLADSRAESLGSRFAHQWLRLQDVGKVWPDAFLYPNFSEQLAEAMVEETELFFNNLVREDRSLLDLFSADYTFLNERLARHYGIDGVSGDEFRRVPYPNEERRGILGHGSVLHLTSMSNRTSPVLRGKWVMEVLMGTPPPPPPPNVPAFEASPQANAGRRLTTRQRMEAHRSAPVCSSCHSFIDPIGLALDNFDVTGTWRIRENMEPLDTKGVFYDGTTISTPSELVQVLLKRPIPLVRNFTEQMLAYAIGRPTEYFDQPTVRAIAGAAEPTNYRMSSLILGIVRSDAFQMRQVQPTADNGGGAER
jgi:hypothetical protein